jgi:hypothetical protein
MPLTKPVCSTHLLPAPASLPHPARQLRHYDVSPRSLDYAAQIDVRGLRGSGRKVTGLVQVRARCEAGPAAVFVERRLRLWHRRVAALG